MNLTDIIKKVKQIEIRSKKKTNSILMGDYHSAFKGQGMTFSEVRQYQFGDDIRRIDWNKTAHFQETFVKIMEEERELSVIFLVDISASMNYGSKTALKRDYIAEICASIGFSAVGNNDKVGLILFSDKVHKVILPQKGKKHLLAMISQIISADYAPTQTNLSEAIKYMLNIFKKKSMVFIFSDFNDNFDEKTLKIVAHKHQLLGIKVSDEKDNTIPNIGYAEILDSETGQKVWVNTSCPKFRADFEEGKRQQNQYIQHIFDKASAGFIDLKTGDDYIKKLHLHLRK